MSRRPRVIDVGDAGFSPIDPSLLVGAIPDDVLRARVDGVVRFKFFGEWELAAANDVSLLYSLLGQAVRLEQTAGYDDPFDWFAELLASDVFLYMEVDPRKPAVRRRFPWVSPFWHMVRFWYGGGVIKSVFAMFSKRTGEYSVNNDDVGLRELAAVWRQVNVVMAEFFVMFNRTVYSRPQQPEWWWDASIKTQSFGVYMRVSGPVAGIDAAYRQLTAVNNPHILSIFRVPPQHVVDTKVLYDTPSQFVVQLAANAHSQWFGYHRIILDTSIAFDLRLPPYVLLEIFDWLPYFDYWPQLRKIELIESVMRSIRRLPACDTRAIRQNRNKE